LALVNLRSTDSHAVQPDSAASRHVVRQGSARVPPNTRLHVLHVGKFYPPHFGGIESHVQALCGELSKSLDVTALVANNGHATSEIFDGRVRVLRVGTLCHFAGAPICPEFVRRIRESKADLVHLHLPNPGAVLAYLASGHRGPLVVSYHSDVLRQKLLGRAFRPILSRFLERAAAVIVTSHRYMATSPVLSSPRNLCHVIPHGIRIAQFQHCDGGEVKRIRDQYGPRIAITVGRLVYYKGLEYLIAAMRNVRGRLLIIGDGPLRSRLEGQVRAEGLSARVVFLGHVGDLVPYYHAADLFVLASVARSEAFGIVQLEAMACGKPVINTRLPSGVPFVSLDGITGITVPPANSEALASAMNSLLDDPVRRMQYGNAARRRVQEEFNLKLMTGRTLQLYRRVMQPPNMSGTFPGLLPAKFGINAGIEKDALASTTRPGSAD
jgi:glycosyltransferase involved in cell wall biosynthesis